MGLTHSNVLALGAPDALARVVFLAVAIAQSPLLLLSADLTLRALAGTSVGVSALTAHGEALAMTKATIAANLHQASNVLPTLTPEVALDEIAIVINAITKTGYFVLSKIANAGVRIDTSLFTNLLALVRPMP